MVVSLFLEGKIITIILSCIEHFGQNFNLRTKQFKKVN